MGRGQETRGVGDIIKELKLGAQGRAFTVDENK
jgi:hypothetical protein